MSLSIKNIIIDSYKIFLSPKIFFTRLKTRKTILEPVIKSVLYGILWGLIAFLWSLFHLVPMGRIGEMLGLFSLVFMPVMSLIVLFVGALMITFMSFLCKGRVDYKAGLQAAGAIEIMFPVYALLTFISGLNLLIGSMIGSIVLLFCIRLSYQAMVFQLDAEAFKSFLVSIVLAFIVIGINICAMVFIQKLPGMESFQVNEQEIMNTQETLRKILKLTNR